MEKGYLFKYTIRLVILIFSTRIIKEKDPSCYIHYKQIIPMYVHPIFCLTELYPKIESVIRCNSEIILLAIVKSNIITISTVVESSASQYGYICVYIIV